MHYVLIFLSILLLILFIIIIFILLLLTCAVRSSWDLCTVSRDRQILHAFVVGLRRKIEVDAKRPVLVLSEARVGYRLAAEPTDPAGAGAQARRPEGE